MALGLVIYFAYGYRHSRMRAAGAPVQAAGAPTE
jgi:hypothetical protein